MEDTLVREMPELEDMKTPVLPMSSMIESAIRNARKVKKTVEFSDPVDSDKWVQVWDDFMINVSFPFDVDPSKKVSYLALNLKLQCRKKGKSAMFSYDKHIHISTLSSWVSKYFQDILSIEASTELKAEFLS
jgi:hypothetical protein